MEQPESGTYDAIVIAVAHEQFKKMSAEDFRQLSRAEHVLFDLKYVLDESEVDIRL